MRKKLWILLHIIWWNTMELLVLFLYCILYINKIGQFLYTNIGYAFHGAEQDHDETHSFSSTYFVCLFCFKSFEISRKVFLSTKYSIKSVVQGTKYIFYHGGVGGGDRTLRAHWTFFSQVAEMFLVLFLWFFK